MTTYATVTNGDVTAYSDDLQQLSLHEPMVVFLGQNFNPIVDYGSIVAIEVYLYTPGRISKYYGSDTNY